MITTDLTSHQSPPAQLTDRETHGLHAGHPFVVDTAELLDHRTRAQTIPAADAPAGHYLAFEDGGTGRLLALSRPITHVGRGLIADLRLEDPHVSRRHAIVALRETCGSSMTAASTGRLSTAARSTSRSSATATSCASVARSSATSRSGVPRTVDPAVVVNVRCAAARREPARRRFVVVAQCCAL
jgi:hypothetical protein